MANFVLIITAPESFGKETFDADADIFAETDNTKTVTNRYTSDATRASVMKILGDSWLFGDGKTFGDGWNFGDSEDGKGEGAYHDYTVTAGLLIIFEAYYKVDCGATLTITLYDQTNGAIIETADKTDSSWTIHDIRITVPAGCTTLRVKFLQKAGNQKAGPFYIDDVSVNASAIATDPDTYRRIPERIGSFHQTLDGRRVRDLSVIHYRLALGWNYIDRDMFDDLKDLYYADEKIYFDDGEVPQLIETETIYDTVTETYVGITNPSTTNIAYTDSSASLPSAVDDFDTSEFSTANYQAIDGDDSNYCSTTNPTDGYYLYHRFELESDVASADAQRLRVKVASLSDDASPSNLDGCILYAWNATDSAWVQLARSTSSAKTDLAYSTADPTIAQSFIDTADNYIRLLLRSRAARDGTNALSLRTYYAEAEVNENLDKVVSLSHKAILDSSDDVVSVKNLTQGTTLVLTTDYTISSDRTEITVPGQSSGDEIEVTYNRYFEVTFDGIPETWLKGDPGSDRSRKLELVLRTVSGSS